MAFIEHWCPTVLILHAVDLFIDQRKSRVLLVIVTVATSVFIVHSANIETHEFELNIQDTNVIDRKFHEVCTNFRTLVKAKGRDEILVGCKGHFLKLNYDLEIEKMANFSVCSNPDPFSCDQIMLTEIDYYCQNYIRTIVELPEDHPDGQYFVCGTNAMVPLCYFIWQNFTRNPPINECNAGDNVRTPGLYNGKELGAVNPNQNISSLFLEDEMQLYTGTSTNYVESQSMIRKSNMSDIANGEKVIVDVAYLEWLSRPQFVGKPIEFGERVYFFLREHAEEFDNAGSTIFSRVAAVCKNDSGGRSNSPLDGIWTTYIKARLNCSVRGDYPFYFDQLQDTFQSTTNKEIVYAVFTTQEYGSAGSALCVYNLFEIEKLVEEAKLKGHVNADSLWLPSPSPIIPRTGRCNVMQPEANYDNLMSYALVDPPVPNLKSYTDIPSLSLNRKSDSPLLVLKDIRFSQLVVKENFTSAEGKRLDIFYVGTEGGTLVKVICGETCLLSQEINLNLNEPVLTMELWSDYIFIGSENSILRVPVNHCDKFTEDWQIFYSKDPHCSTNEEDVTIDVPVVPETVEEATHGDVVYLFCHALTADGFSLQLDWYKDEDILTQLGEDQGDQFVEYNMFLQGSIEYDVVYGVKVENEVRSQLRIFVTESTIGTYSCRVYGVNLPSQTYNASVTMKEDYAVTEKSYSWRICEGERLKNISQTIYDQFSHDNTCVISDYNVCSALTSMDGVLAFNQQEADPYMNIYNDKTDCIVET